MAGCPRIMQVMLDAVRRGLPKVGRCLRRSVRIDAPEATWLPASSELQSAHPDVQIGSYPFFENKRLGTYVVLRSTDGSKVEAAQTDLWKRIHKEGFAAAAGGDE
jgi:molybdopterin-biosynthesis enzyme MoeA-like protein